MIEFYLPNFDDSGSDIMKPTFKPVGNGALAQVQGVDLAAGASPEKLLQQLRHDEF